MVKRRCTPVKLLSDPLTRSCRVSSSATAIVASAMKRCGSPTLEVAQQLAPAQHLEACGQAGDLGAAR
jgi:hypothetical protein